MKLTTPLFAVTLLLLPTLAMAGPAIATTTDINDVRLDHAGWDSSLTRSPTGLGASYDEEDVTSDSDIERPTLQISDDRDEPRDTGVLFGSKALTISQGQ